MTDPRKDLLVLVKDFINRCKKNNIWYVIDEDTLLGAVKHGGFLPWNIHFQVLMTPTSYRRLLRLYPNNVLDSFIRTDYDREVSCFLDDVNSWKDQKSFIDIKIVVPTTTDKVADYNNKMKFFKDKQKGKRDNIRVTINDLFDEDFEGYYIVEKRFSKQNRFSQNFLLDTKEITFCGFKVNAPKYPEKYLQDWYGSDFIDSPPPGIQFEYTHPGNRKKVSI